MSPDLEQTEPWVTSAENPQTVVPRTGPRGMQKTQRAATLFRRAEKSIGGTPSHKEVRRRQDGQRTEGKRFQPGRFPPEQFAARQGGPGHRLQRGFS